MKTRILSGIVLGVITVSSLLIGGVYMFCICLAISILGMSEYYKVVGLQKNILGIIGYICSFMLRISFCGTFGDIIILSYNIGYGNACRICPDISRNRHR